MQADRAFSGVERARSVVKKLTDQFSAASTSGKASQVELDGAEAKLDGAKAEASSAAAKDKTELDISSQVAA